MSEKHLEFPVDLRPVQKIIESLQYAIKQIDVIHAMAGHPNAEVAKSQIRKQCETAMEKLDHMMHDA